MQNDSEENKASEPQPVYNSHSNQNDFKIFHSFQEAEDDNNKWLASLTPDQHLQNAVVLIKRLYSSQLASNTDSEAHFIID